MAGPGIRYFEMAKVFSQHFETTLFVPDSCDFKSDDFQIITYNSAKSSSSIAKKLGNCDYVIAQNLRPTLIKFIKQNKIRYISDQYDPLLIEILEYTKGDSQQLKQNTSKFIYHLTMLQFFTADHVLCASEIQKSFYLGLMSGNQLISPNEYKNDPGLNNFMSLLPFGISQDKPIYTNPNQMEEKFPQIKPDDKIIYWGGGVWNWFDALSAVKAIEIISKKRSDIKLFFLGTRPPNPKIKEMAMVGRTVDYCRQHNLLDKFVFFNFGWTPYEERVNYLLRSSVGISTHFSSLETRFSFRTRVLDYFWAELPMVLTKGDYMADLTQKHNLGLVVDYQDSTAIAAAIEKIIDHPDTYKIMKANIVEFKKQFLWEQSAKELIEKVKSDKIVFHPISPSKFQALQFNFYYWGFRKKFFK
ncbi:MAG: hypothetical protein Q7S37_05190 [bacterium]|nr:hypothetical protein [bacterium]